MRRAAWWLVPAASLATVLLPAAQADAARTLNGAFHWNQGADGDLEAVFTPAGEDAWDVEFRFRFQGRSHTYRGTAEGSLFQGTLRGTVRNEDRRRTFTFEGRFREGAFRGTHAETIGGRSTRTGTLTLG